MSFFKPEKRLPGENHTTQEATSRRNTVGNPILRSQSSRAVAKTATSYYNTVMPTLLAQEREVLGDRPRLPLTEENLRKLNASHESLRFTATDFLDIAHVKELVKPVVDPDGFEVTEEDTLGFVCVEDETERDWSTLVAPGSKQFSDWAFEDDGEDDGSADAAVEDRQWEDGGNQGFTHAGEVFGIVKGFARSMPL